MFCATELLQNILGRFSIHQTILFAVGHELMAMDVDRLMKKPNNGQIGYHLLALSSWIDELTRVSEVPHQHGLDCGIHRCDLWMLLCAFFSCSVKCAKADSRQQFRRCSGCKLVQYCSKACQKRHWHEQHRTLCPPDRGQCSCFFNSLI